MDANQVFAVLWAKLNSVAKEKGLEQKVVTVLPATGEKSYLYFVPNGSTGDNYYDEYVWDTEREVFERVGSTDVVLPEPDGSTLVETNGVWSVNIAQNAGAHNAVYRGKYLGNQATDEQYSSISAGSFNDLFIGDYWTIGEVNYRIAAFDYYMNMGDKYDAVKNPEGKITTEHHILLIPDAPLYKGIMNNVTNQNYIVTKMYGDDYTHVNGTLYNAAQTIKSAFPGHILKHRIYLPTAITNEKNDSYSAFWSEIELLTERMIYGNVVEGALKKDLSTDLIYETGQLPLFALDRSKICTDGIAYWLRDICDNTRFALNEGVSTSGTPAQSWGIRPYFCIYGGEN